LSAEQKQLVVFYINTRMNYALREVFTNRIVNFVDN